MELSAKAFGNRAEKKLAFLASERSKKAGDKEKMLLSSFEVRELKDKGNDTTFERGNK